MAEGYSHADFNRLAHENARMRSREANEKSKAVEFTEKAVVGLSAAAVGFGLGAYEAQQGATAEAPYQIGGNVPVDALAAGLGAVAILATPVRGSSSKLLPVSLGAGSAAIGIWAHRAGFQWQQSRAGTSTTSTTAGPLLFGGMHTRPFGHGPGIYGGIRNPYVDALG